MWDSPVECMYLRPGNLYMDFEQIKLIQRISDTGIPYNVYERTGKIYCGTLTSADTQMSERHKHLWDQDQHSLTHMSVSRGGACMKKGDVVTTGERYFNVLLADDESGIGVSTVYYLEERNDVR